MSDRRPLENKGTEMAYSWICPVCNHQWISVLRTPSLCTCGFSRVTAAKREDEAKRRLRKRLDYALQKQLRSHVHEGAVQ